MSQNTPESPLSRSVIKKVAPGLQQEFELQNLQWGANVYLRLFKQERELQLWVRSDVHFELFKTYPICTYGFGSLGPKLAEGDGQAPEGFYFITPRSLNPYSQYHLSMNLGFPNRYDRDLNRTGSALMIHGSCVSIGCFAMTDAYIEEIYTVVHAAFQHGQKFVRVHSFPFKMTETQLESHKDSQWHPFWLNLKQGYDWFEKDKTPPNVEVIDAKYVFNKE